MRGSQETVAPARMGKKVLFLALDNSGSMCGAPFKGLIEGSKMVGKSVFESGAFDHFFTIFHNHAEETREFQDQKTYEDYLDKQRAGGGNEFRLVFLSMLKQMEQIDNV